jgi:hypothetical protein
LMETSTFRAAEVTSTTITPPILTDCT